MSPATPPGDGPAGTKEARAALSRELGELLIELSIGVHRFAMYPPGHPSLAPVAENILSRLGEVFRDRDSLSIGVARDQLVIEGVATEQKHPVLSDLARRLHDEQLGALTFRRGLLVDEVESLLRTLAQESTEEEETPLGRLPEEEIPSWEHVQVFPVGYGQLSLKEGEGVPGEVEGDRATQLWLGLAQAALTSERPFSPEEVPDAEVVADRIRSHEKEAAYDQVIVGYMLQLADELKGATGERADRIRERVSRLIRELDDPTLERLVQMGGDVDQRQKFVLDANESLAVDAVIKVLQASASASQQTISNSLTRLLSKLAIHAEQGSSGIRGQADTALRENVDELIDEWELDDPNPDQYTQVLDAMSSAAPIFEHPEAMDGGGGRSAPGAFRLLQMALEVDSYGPIVESAVSELLDRGELPRILMLADGAPQGSGVAERIRRYATDPRQLERILSNPEVSEEALESIVERLGAAAVAPLLDALSTSESRALRRKVFDQLAGMDVEMGPQIMARLEDARWFTVRNVLALVQRLDEVPEGLDPGPYLAHPDVRVRREAFPVAVSHPPTRERALAAGLGDEDGRIVRMALLELQEGLPETLVPTVVNRVVESEHPEALRAMGVRALEHSRSNLARETLLGVADGGRTLLGRRKVADASRPVLDALRVLKRKWADDPTAKKLLDAARRSRDHDLRSAVRDDSERIP